MSSITLGYDAFGLSIPMTPTGVYRYNYDAARGTLNSVVGPDRSRVSCTYDGSLVKE